MFVVFDGEYKVGEFIVIDGWRGSVVEIGIRTTKIMDEGGNIMYINNTIRAVINQSQEPSVIKCELPVYGVDALERIEAQIKAYMPRIGDRIPLIEDGPY